MNENQKNDINDTTRFYAKLRQHPVYRVLAMVCVLIIAALVVCVLVTGITGSKYFMGFLVLLMVVPFMIYVFLWLARLMSNLYDEKLEKAGEEQMESSHEEHKD